MSTPDELPSIPVVFLSQIATIPLSLTISIIPRSLLLHPKLSSYLHCFGPMGPREIPFVHRLNTIRYVSNSVKTKAGARKSAGTSTAKRTRTPAARNAEPTDTSRSSAKGKPINNDVENTSANGSAGPTLHPKHTLSIRGANLHNLKNVSLDLPRNRMIVFSGVSGSGKSSLAFNTIYAEGQRRYVESLSSYARQFLSRMAKPEVESITGLAPAVAIEQQTLQRNPRSTVGTTTEVYDYLRLLYGRIGGTICKNCNLPVRRDTPRIVQESLAVLSEGTRLYVLFPMTSHESRTLAEELNALRERGFFRIVLEESTEIIDLNDEAAFKKVAGKKSRVEKQDVYILVDRIVWRDDDTLRTRVAEASETGFREGDGRIEVRELESGKRYFFSRRYECSNCGSRYQEPEPRLFGFNNPFGACPECQGFGRAIGIDMDLVIPDRSKSIRQGAIAAFSTPKHSQYYRDLLAVARRAGLDTNKPMSLLTDEEWGIVMDGFGEYEGINGFFTMIEKNTHKMHYRVYLSRFRGYTTCPKCKGSRLRPSAMQVFVHGKRIHEITAMTIEFAVQWFRELQLTAFEEQIAGRILEEITKRLHFLNEVGLGYLRLDRLSHTLSGGETQRINLATSIGSALVGAMYVLDEPSIGLHPRDTGRLIRILHELRDLGNTVILVEHDPEIIQSANIVVDMGPRAGEGGGEVVFRGTVEEMLKDDRSVTGAFLSGRSTIPTPKKRRTPKKGDEIILRNASRNNLKNVTAAFPLNVLTVVTGVSGSGKSTLVHDVLYQAAAHRIGKGTIKEENGLEVQGIERIDSVEMIDQSPIGRTPRSNPATYTKAFDAIRDLFSGTAFAKLNGWKAGYFSFNVPGGRCEVCQGEGSVTVDMQFLADVQLPCDSCKGTRFKSEVLNAKFNGKSIVDVLEMTVDEALEFFDGQKKITRKLQGLQDVGLGYIRLGQPATTLSGGEAQRVKLASHLMSPDNGHTLFIFDEPTTGLHMSDVAVLLRAFNSLIKAGHSVVVIEHNLDVMRAADWIIDLGPDGGDRGGEIVATGSPESVAANKASITGKFLKAIL